MDPLRELQEKFCEHREPVLSEATCFNSHKTCPFSLGKVRLDEEDRPYIPNCQSFRPTTMYRGELLDYLRSRRESLREKRKRHRHRRN